MKLSLITATYNSADIIINAISSVKDQKIDDLEYIIIDGGSTDGTLEIIKDNTDIVSKWISEPDKGIYDALNKGLRMASGDIVGFLHSDDNFANSSILQNIIDSFDKQSIDFLYGDLEYITSAEPHKVLRYWKSGNFTSKKLRKGWMPPHPTVYFKRELIEKVGQFDTSYTISADYDWMVRCLTSSEIKVDYIPEVLIKMRTGGASNRSLKNIIKKSREDYKIIRRNKIGGFNTLFYKNFGKIGQFFKHV